MDMAGLHFNNSNWPHILRVIRTWCVTTLAVWPALCWILQTVLERILPGQAGVVVQFAVLWTAILGGLLIPVYVVGWKYK